MRDFREMLIATGALEKLFERLNAALEETPKQRNTREEKADIKPKLWKNNPHKLQQKDMDDRWAERFVKVRRKGAKASNSYTLCYKNI